MITPPKYSTAPKIVTEQLRTWRRRFFSFLLASFLCLAGCASWHWEKHGASDDDYTLDEKNCKIQSYSGTDGMVTQASVRKMHNCLQAKGWHKVEN
ncbi:MAG: hypothetical protein ABTQ26_09755 [Azonexus sp.]